jgi:hypothetical protein
MAAIFDAVVDGLGVPFGWYAGGEQGLHFRR